MTSDFTPLALSLHHELSPLQLHELCRSLLILTRSGPPWLKERWRSYLSHLCAIPIGSPVDLTSPQPSREQLTSILAHLLLITPIERRPSDQELKEWLDQWPDRPSTEAIREYCVRLESMYLAEQINL